MKLTIIRGLQASGKDTEARKIVKADIEAGITTPAMIVNRDHLRFMAGLDTKPGPYENTITLQQHALIRAGLKARRHVISSDTNLNEKFVKGLAKIAEKFAAEVKVVDMDVPLEECIRRDIARGTTGGHSVGADVIRNTHKRYFTGGKFPANPLTDLATPVKLEPYVRDVTLPRVKIWDVDGTLASHGSRSPYDYTKVLLDDPTEVIGELVDSWELGYRNIVLSGREDSCRQDTIKWLRKHTGLPIETDSQDSIPVFMRKAGDDRADFIVKYELFMQNIAPFYNVVAWYDDRNQVVDMARSIGIRVYQVNYGDF